MTSKVMTQAPHILRTVLLASGMAASVFYPALASGQTNYSADNFNTNAGYLRGSGISSPNQPANLRWQGNDPYDPNTLLGETDLVARVSGYTPSPLANSSVIQGGLGVGDGVLPGTNSVRIWKTFTPSATSILTAEWSLIPSLEGAPYNLADTFAFDLRDAGNASSLLKVQLTPGINIQSNSYTLQVLAAGAPTQTVIDLGYQGLFQVEVALNNTSWNLSLSQINSTNRSVIVAYTNLASGVLSTGTTAADFATFGLDWDLASGNNLEPGSNYIILNDVLVVPEPSTYALLGMAVLGLLVFLGRQRRA